MPKLNCTHFYKFLFIVKHVTQFIYTLTKLTTLKEHPAHERQTIYFCLFVNWIRSDGLNALPVLYHPQHSYESWQESMSKRKLLPFILRVPWQCTFCFSTDMKLPSYYMFCQYPRSSLSSPFFIVWRVWQYCIFTKCFL